MKITNKTVLVTGANRGIGLALVEEALKRGAKRIYAGTRVPFTHRDPRVMPVRLDVTNEDQIREVAAQTGSLDILINNAGVAYYDDLNDPAMIERHLAVNLFGPYNVAQAFVPALVRSQGAIVNVLSIAALAPVPVIASYSISKAAAFSMTKALRAFLAGKGVRVHAVLPGPIDTDMNRGLDIPKASPESAAANILDGIENDEDEIFPDPASATMAESWRESAIKDLERRYATFLPTPQLEMS